MSPHPSVGSWKLGRSAWSGSVVVVVFTRGVNRKNMIPLRISRLPENVSWNCRLKLIAIQKCRDKKCSHFVCRHRRKDARVIVSRHFLLSVSHPIGFPPCLQSFFYINRRLPIYCTVYDLGYSRNCISDTHFSNMSRICSNGGWTTVARQNSG